jgi:1-acyl-sn-glycerol-3-phosphate acyltransferase
MLYPFIKAIAWFYIRLRCRVRAKGVENIPEAGGVILCSNHTDFFDPVVIATGIKRPVHFMAKKELFKNPVGKWFFKSINAFPVDRGTTDLKSYKQTLALLKDGKVLGIFAQGTRIKEADVTAAKSGTAMFALKTGAVVVPVGISGNYKWFSKVYIEFGKPVNLDAYADTKIKRETLDEVTEIIVGGINEILNKRG